MWFEVQAVGLWQTSCCYTVCSETELRRMWKIWSISKQQLVVTNILKYAPACRWQGHIQGVSRAIFNLWQVWDMGEDSFHAYWLLVHHSEILMICNVQCMCNMFTNYHAKQACFKIQNPIKPNKRKWITNCSLFMFHHLCLFLLTT